MSILTFGGGNDSVNDTTNQQQPGMGEELREERLNQQLMDAYTKKQAGQYFEALTSYTAVLEDDFLKDAKIDKHIFMRYNAQKNCGEVYEKMENFSLAKYHYIQALKIRQEDSFIWTRLGYIEFERLNDLKMAQSCFDAAAKTLTTLEKRGMKMCPILVKLAEINFLLYDFKASEAMVDALIQRSLPEPNSLLFGYLLKSYFCTLKNEPILAQECLKRAQNLQPDARVEDLSIIKRMQERAARQMSFNESSQAGTQPSDSVMKITIEESEEDSLASFPEFFAHFLGNFSSTLEVKMTEIKNCQKLTLDCSEYLGVLQKNKAKMISSWEASFRQSETIEPSNQMQVDELANTDTNKVNTDASMKEATSQPNQKQKVVEVKRSQRRKVDNDDLLMRKLNLEAFDNFKESILFREDFNEITSHSQIKAIQTLFQKRTNSSKTAADKLNILESARANIGSSSNRDVPPTSLLDQFENILDRATGKNVFYIARNLLRFVIDGVATDLLRQALAFDFFRLYTLVIQASGPCSKAMSGMHLLDQFGSFNVVLVMFELALFNKDVIKKAKSGPVMSHRQSIFSYLNQFIDTQQSKNQNQANEASNRETYADFKLREQLAHLFKHDKTRQAMAFDQFKVRLLYAMMFYSFEIQNDMPLSVTIYQMLDINKLYDIGAIHQPWISDDSILDFQKISTFGNCKIQEAQKVRDFDQAINALKSAEVQQMKKGGANASVDDKNKYRPECIRYAKFYLEQFFNYLILALSSDSASGGAATSLSVSFASNEEKIKEMWEKLCYSLSRSETSEMLSIVQYIFCTLTAFQILHKTYYDSFILKRLDFDKLIQSISDRFKNVLSEVWSLKQMQQQENRTDQVARQKLEEILDRPDIDMFLVKMEVHLLRLFTPEFLHSNVRQHGEQDNQFLLAYYKSLFCLQMTLGCLSRDQGKAYEPVCDFLKGLDFLAQDNSELFHRPYLRLIQFAFPYLQHLFLIRTSDLRQEANLQELKRFLQGPLSTSVEAGLAYFLNFKLKVSFSEMLPTVDLSRQGDEEMREDDQEFSYLISQSNIQSGQNTLTGQSQFQAMMLQSNGKPDVHMLADLIKCIDFCMEGRLLNHASLQVNDIKTLLKITDSIGNLIFSNRNWLTERCPASKERCIAIKNTYRDVNLHNINASTLNRTSWSCLCVQQQKKQESCFEPGFPEALSLVIFFLLNVFSQIGLPTSSAILPNISLGLRTQFLERLSSLSELKKLRALIYIDLQYSEHLDVTSLMMSYVFLQYYKTSNEAKIQRAYNELNEYKDMRQFHKQASNCVITTLSFLLKSQQQQRENGVWQNISTPQFMKIAMEQLLQVQLSRIRGKEHVKFMMQPLAMPSLQTYLTPFVYLPSTEKDVRAIKLRLLRDEASLYAYICAQLDILSVPITQSSDPRARQLPRQKLFTAAQHIVQILLEEVTQTQQDKPMLCVAKVKQMLLSDKYVQVCRSRLHQIVSDPELTMALRVVPQAQLTYDYFYLQAVLQQEDELQINPESMLLYMRALEVAIANNNSGGVFSIMLKIIEMSLLIASQLKYNSGPSMTDETRTRYQQILDTVSKQVLYERSLKAMMDQFLALTMHNVYESNERINQIMAGKQGAVLEFQFDQESIIYDRFASSTVRQRLMKKQSFSEIDQIEKILTKLYDTGDRLVYMLTKSFQKSSCGQASMSANQTQQANGKTMQGSPDFYKELLKVEYNQVLAKNLFYEFQKSIEIKIQTILSQGQRPRMNQWQEGWTLVREMQASINKDLQNINEILQIQIQNFQQQWGSDSALCPMGVIKSNTVSGKYLLNLQTVQSSLTQFFSVEPETKVQADGKDRGTFISEAQRSKKSLVCFTNFNVFTAGILRCKVKQLLLSVCEKSEDYEPARDIFKATITKVKQNFSQQNDCKYSELHAVFELSKKTYLHLITEHADSIYSQFANLSCQLRQNTSQTMHSKLYHAYSELRQKYHTSSEVIPHILKDIFEIFVDTHNSKMFLRKMELLTGEQQLLLRQSVLKVCATCGPDSEQSNSGQITSKFLNLAKLEDRDYLYEGLRICISWFEKVLEGTATSHNIGTNQALTGKLTSRGSKNASDLRRKLLETFEEMERRIDGGTMARDQPQQPQQTPNLMAASTVVARSQAQGQNNKVGGGAGVAGKDAFQAQQVFKQGGFGTMAPQRK